MTVGPDQAERMDRMYRFQRLIYDPTRRFYLIGRDRLIDGLDVPAGGRVLEVGCGTGRNLVRIARRYPASMLFGLDVSEQMLRSARAKRYRLGLAERVTLAQGDASRFDPERCFAGVAPFERIVIAFGLSMIPDWRATIECAVAALAPGGSLHVVDFGDMAGWSPIARQGMRRWLRLFDVVPRPEMREVVAGHGEALGARLTVEDLLGGYSHLVRLRSADPSSGALRQRSVAAVPTGDLRPRLPGHP